MTRFWWGVAGVAVPLVSWPPSPAGAVLGVAAYAPLFVFLRRSGRGWAAAAGAAVAAGQVLVLAPWAAETVSRPGLVLAALTGWGAAFWVPSCLAVRWLLRRPSPAGRAAAVGVIPVAEWVRAENTTLPLGYLLTPHQVAENLWLAQAVEVVGFHGLAVLLCASAWWLSEAAGPPVRWRAVGGWAAAVAAAHACGLARLAALPDAPAHVEVAVLQQYAPRDPDDEPRRTPGDVLDAIPRLVGSRPAVLVCPESTAFVPAPRPEGTTAEGDRPTPVQLAGRAASSGCPVVVTGCLIETARGDGGYRNAVVVARPDGVLAAADKATPAPLGEVVPFAGVPGLERLGAAVSDPPAPLVAEDPRGWVDVPGAGRWAVAVCNEHTSPGVWRDRGVRDFRGIDLQLVVADLGWFRYSPAERGQSRAARTLLAVRHRTPLLYAANGGSELISADGRLRRSLPPAAPGAVWRVPLGGVGRGWTAGVAAHFPLGCLLCWAAWRVAARPAGARSRSRRVQGV